MQPKSVDLCLTKTPSQHDQKEFFKNDQGIKVFRGACDENALHQSKRTDDDHLWTDSRSQEGSQVQATSSISISRSQNQSQTNSFKPELTKEMKTLERTNKKLKEHQDQYRKFYAEILQQDYVQEEGPAERSEQPQAYSRNDGETVLLEENAGSSSSMVYMDCKKLSDSGTESLVSNSTSQGYTTVQAAKS